MRKGNLVFFVLAAAFMSFATLFGLQASALAQPPVAPPVEPSNSNPSAPAAASPLSTYFYVQNLDQAITGNITTTIYNTSGAVAGSDTKTASPNRSVLVDQRTCCGPLPPGFQGSGVVTSTTDIGSVTNEVAAAALGKAFRADSYNSIPGLSAQTSLFFPQLLWNVQDPVAQLNYTSTIAFQNAGSAAGTVQLSFFPYAGFTCPTSPVIVNSPSILPGATWYMNMGTQPEFANCTGPGSVKQTYGSASMTSTQLMAAVTNQNADGGLSVWLGYANTDGGTTIIVPQLVKNVPDPAQGATRSVGTGVQVMNPAGTSTTINAVFNTFLSGSQIPGCTGGQSAATINETQTANPAAVFDQRLDPAITTTCWYGSATFTASTSIIAIVNVVSNVDPTAGVRVSSTRAFPSTAGSLTVFIPHIAKALVLPEAVSWGTAIQVQLQGSGSGTVTATYYMDSGGGTCSESRPIGGAAGNVAVFDQRLFDFTPCGAGATNVSGSAKLTSTVGIVATVNQVGGTADSGDALGQYFGINR